MGVEHKKQAYEDRQREWEEIRDAIEGQRVVKRKGARYLPAPPGMETTVSHLLITGHEDPRRRSRYDFYLSFGEFPEIVGPAVEGFQGIIHHKAPKIELPAEMEYLLEDATPKGTTIEGLWQAITREVISTGRVSLLCEVGDDDVVRLVWHSTESLINWGTDFVVLHEEIEETDPDDPFRTHPVQKYVELRLIDGVYTSTVHTKRKGEDIVQGPTVPVQRFGAPLTLLPLTVINTLDLGLEYSPSPILGMVRRTYSIYRHTADYKRALYMKGDPQPWGTGIAPEEVPDRIGGEDFWAFSSEQAKVGYLDVDGKGIPLLRQAIVDEYDRFDDEGGRLLSVSDRTQPESGEALRRRQAAQQVTLKNLVLNAGEGLQEALRKVADLLGLDRDEVRFVPDTDFAEARISGAEVLQMTQAMNETAPLSKQSFHETIRRGGWTELTFDEEMDQIQTEIKSADIEDRTKSGLIREATAEDDPLLDTEDDDNTALP